LIEAEIRQTQQAEEELIARIYGDEDLGKIKIRPVSRSSIVILSLEEMINEAIITVMEEYPTYNRDPKLIAKARIQSAQESKEETSVKRSPSASTDRNAPIIRFN
jgi:cell division protein FtsZ